MSSPSILYLVNDSSFFISHRLPTALAAIKEGFEVHVASNMHNNKKYLESLGFLCHDLPFSRGSLNIFKELSVMLKIFFLYREVNPSLFCQETIKPVLYGTLVSKILPRKPIVNTITGLGYLFISEKKIHIFFQKTLLFIYKKIFASSMVHTIFENHDDADLFIKRNIVKKNNISIIKGAGVDTKKIQPNFVKPKLISIILVARMLWDKGVGEFVDAARIIKSNTNVKFILVGGEDLENPKGIKRNLLNQWVKEGIVTWYGYSNSVEKILNESHIACLPSYREGLPKSLIEAAAAGLPIVTTDVPGCREVVKNNINGLIVPPKNSILLSEALLFLINNSQVRKKMGQKSRKFAVEKFSLEIIIKSTLDLYKNVTRNQK